MIRTAAGPAPRRFRCSGGFTLLAALVPAGFAVVAPGALLARVPAPEAGVVDAPLAADQVGTGSTEEPPTYRYGLTLGGSAFISLVFEYESGNRAVELALGTFSGRDLSVAVTGKQYLGGGDLRGFAGAGLWGVAAFPADQRAGFALIARAPAGVDWRALDRHATGVELNLNRALAMRRPDPLDERPPRTRIVPLPALYYRFANAR